MKRKCTWQRGVIRVLQLGAAMAILLWPLSGLAQSDDTVVFEPKIKENLEARPGPAKVTTEELRALQRMGYVELGSISDRWPGAGAERTPALRNEILRKAAEVGGDVVHFYKEGVLTEVEVSVGKTKRFCTGWETKTTPVLTTVWSNRPDGSRQANNVWADQTTRTCVKWDESRDKRAKKKTMPGLVSDGWVYRFDPELSAKLAGEEIPSPADIERMAKLNDFRIAVDSGDLPTIEALVKAHPDWVQGGLYGRDMAGETPLHWAVWAGRKDVVEVLLAHGADVNAKN